jgi:hypothetical protein
VKLSILKPTPATLDALACLRPPEPHLRVT